MSRKVDIILMQTRPGVGSVGQRRRVALGYYRNFLLPNRLALIANKHHVMQCNHLLKKATAHLKKVREEAEQARDVIHEKTVTLSRKTHGNDRLYASVTARAITLAIQDAFSVDIDEKKVVIDQPIRQTGRYSVTVGFYENVAAVVQLVVTAEPDEGGVSKASSRGS